MTTFETITTNTRLAGQREQDSRSALWVAAVASTQQTASSSQPAIKPVPPVQPRGEVIKPNVPQWQHQPPTLPETPLMPRILGYGARVGGLAAGFYFSMTGPAGTPPIMGTLPGNLNYRYAEDEGTLSISDSAGRPLASARPRNDGTFRTTSGEIVARDDHSGQGFAFDTGFLEKLQPGGVMSGQPSWADKINPKTGVAYQSEAEYNRTPFRCARR